MEAIAYLRRANALNSQELWLHGEQCSAVEVVRGWRVVSAEIVDIPILAAPWR